MTIDDFEATSKLQAQAIKVSQLNYAQSHKIINSLFQNSHIIVNRVEHYHAFSESRTDLTSSETSNRNFASSVSELTYFTAFTRMGLRKHHYCYSNVLIEDIDYSGANSSKERCKVPSLLFKLRFGFNNDGSDGRR
jgi:hypothetical protein